MIRNFILLAIGLALSFNLSGQQKSILPFGSRIQCQANKGRTALKSTAVFKQKMDSLVWQDYDTISGWKINDTERYTYDSKGRLIQAFIYSSYTPDGEFFWFKDTVSYHANGKPSLEARFARKLENEPWRLESKAVTFYDALGNDTLSLHYGLDSLNQEQLRSKQLKTFDSGGNPLTLSVYQWSDNTSIWLPSSKSETTYDSLGKQIQVVNYSWKTELSNWIAQDKTINTYDSKSNLTEDLIYTWSSVSRTWIPNTRNTHTYNAFGYESLWQCFTYNLSTQTWMDDFNLEMDFDEFGNLWHSLELYSKDSAGEWTDKFKVDYRFNLAFDQNEIALPFVWEGKVPVHMYLGFMAWRWNNSTKEWYEKVKLDYYYSEFTGSGIDPITQIQPILIYPNPVTDFIVIETEQPAKPMLFELTDITGKQVISITLNGARNQVSVSGLPDGLYLYRIIRNGGSYQGKVIKR